MVTESGTTAEPQSREAPACAAGATASVAARSIVRQLILPPADPGYVILRRRSGILFQGLPRRPWRSHLRRRRWRVHVGSKGVVGSGGDFASFPWRRA